MRNNEYSKFRWFLLFVLLVVGTGQAIALIAPSPLVGEVANSLGVSAGEATFFAMGSFTFSVAISAIIGGPIIDKFGVVKVWIVCAVMMTVGLALTPSIAVTGGGLLATRVIEGLGAGPIMATAAALGARYFPVNERGIVTGVQGMTMGLGIALGFIIVPQVFQATGSWQVAMSKLAILTAIGLVLAIIAAFYDKKAAINNTNENEENIDHSHDMKKAVALPTTWIAVAIIFILSWAQQAFNDMTPGYISIPAPTGLGQGAVTAGQLMVGAQLAGIVGAILSGFLVDKIFKGKAKQLIMVSYVLSAILVFMLKVSGVYSNLSLLGVVIALVGFFTNIVNPTVLGFVAKNYPTHICGKVGGMVLGIGIFGGTVGVAAGSLALHTTGNYMVSITIISVLSLVGAIVAFYLNKPKVFSNDTIDDKSKTVEV